MRAIATSCALGTVASPKTTRTRTHTHTHTTLTSRGLGWFGRYNKPEALLDFVTRLGQAPPKKIQFVDDNSDNVFNMFHFFASRQLEQLAAGYRHTLPKRHTRHDTHDTTHDTHTQRMR